MMSSSFFTVDEFNADFISGWFIGSEKEIKVFVNGAEVGNATLGYPRPDVAKHYPEYVDAPKSGFRFVFNDTSRPPFHPGKNALILKAQAGDFSKEVAADIYVPTASVAEGRHPFSPGVAAQIAQILGTDFLKKNFLDPDIEAQAVDALVFAIRRGSRYSPAVWSYASFLARTWYQVATISRQFPVFNRISRYVSDTEYAPYNAVDVHCVQSAPLSMLALASHLYILKSRDISGRVFEFGCFKGYSTCCISLACKALGLRLATFDSFEGLPAINGHQPGGYKGTFDEVQNNVNIFGAPDVVTFYKGFYSNSMKDMQKEKVFSIFMDVDFEASAHDMAKTVGWVDPQGAIFSDETIPENFLAGRVTVSRGPESVLPPILDAFDKEGRVAVGRHLHCNLGALWDERSGIPVLSIPGLKSLLTAVLPESIPEA
jgi:hypothetical protein